MDTFIQSLINTLIRFVPLVLAVTLHEAAHGYAALKCGDDTALKQGRITLNPFKHIDPVGTLLIPGVLLLIHAPILLGYAKPVPINFRNLRHPKRDIGAVALAGPGMNFMLMLVSAFTLKIMSLFGASAQTPLGDFLVSFLIINCFIGLFNLLPILPLDGGRVLWSFLPATQADRFQRTEPYGMFLIFGALLILPWLLGINPLGWLLRTLNFGIINFCLKIFGL